MNTPKSTQSEKMALLRTKVAGLKAKMDAFKPKKTVKKKAVSAQGPTAQGGGSANRDTNDTPMSTGSDLPSQPGSLALI